MKMSANLQPDRPAYRPALDRRHRHGGPEAVTCLLILTRHGSIVILLAIGKNVLRPYAEEVNLCAYKLDSNGNKIFLYKKIMYITYISSFYRPITRREMLQSQEGPN